MSKCTRRERFAKTIVLRPLEWKALHCLSQISLYTYTLFYSVHISSKMEAVHKTSAGLDVKENKLQAIEATFISPLHGLIGLYFAQLITVNGCTLKGYLTMSGHSLRLSSYAGNQFIIFKHYLDNTHIITPLYLDHPSQIHRPKHPRQSPRRMNQWKRDFNCRFDELSKIHSYIPRLEFPLRISQYSIYSIVIIDISRQWD